MENFFRALRFAWPYRRRFAASVVCALMVALFWGANLTAVFPILKVIFRDQSLQEWIHEVVEKHESVLSTLERQVAAGQRELEEVIESRPDGQGESAQLVSELKRSQLELKQARWKDRWYRMGQAVIDHRSVPRDRGQTLVLVILFLIVGLALKGVFSFLGETLVGSVTQLAMFDLKNRMYRHSLKMDLTTFHQQASSELMARFTNDMETLASGMTTLLGKMIREPLKALVCILLACWLNWRLTLVVLALVPVAVLLMSTIGRYIRRATRRCLESMASIYRILQETFQGIKVVKAFTMERCEKRRFFVETKNYYRKSMRIVKLEALIRPLMELIGVGAIAVAVLIGAFLVMGKTDRVFGIKMADGPMSPETLALLYAFLAGVSDPARKLSNVYGRIQRGSAAADRIFVYLDQQAKITDPPRAVGLPRHQQHVEWKDVHFSYPGSAPVLQNVNLRARSGETVAIVGPNGCGKSTLVSLLVRFYEPQKGQVLIDGVDVRNAPRRSLRRQIGLVTQETLLFNDTVLNNIGYGDRSATRAEIEAAARRAYVHRFIETLPEAYDTYLGERAVKVSGGQRQRIALARAILRNPAILILDEPTSALDLESESLIQRALREFMRNRTTFVITHRLGMLELADRIVVMDAGQIRDVGRHDELVRRCELYIRLREIDSARRISA